MYCTVRPNKQLTKDISSKMPYACQKMKYIILVGIRKSYSIINDSKNQKVDGVVGLSPVSYEMWDDSRYRYEYIPPRYEITQPWNSPPCVWDPLTLFSFQLSFIDSSPQKVKKVPQNIVLCWCICHGKERRFNYPHTKYVFFSLLFLIIDDLHI